MNPKALLLVYGFLLFGEGCRKNTREHLHAFNGTIIDFTDKKPLEGMKVVLTSHPKMGSNYIGEQPILERLDSTITNSLGAFRFTRMANTELNYFQVEVIPDPALYFDNVRDNNEFYMPKRSARSSYWKESDTHSVTQIPMIRVCALHLQIKNLFFQDTIHDFSSNSGYFSYLFSKSIEKLHVDTSLVLQFNLNSLVRCRYYIGNEMTEIECKDVKLAEWDTLPYTLTY